MKANEQTLQQLERVINKISQKFPVSEEVDMLTDIHVSVSQDSGEVLVFDDDSVEVTRCVVEQWIDCKDETFYDDVAQTFRDVLNKLSDVAGKLGILKPYSFVLEDDERNHVAELFLADDETVIIGGDLMKGLNEDLDNFIDELLKN